MLFQDATPDTSGYMIAGYVVAFVVMALYVASMYMRSRNLKQDMSMLEEMDKPAPVQKQSVSKTASATPAKTVTKKRVKK
jgi:uncharacterized protein with FMN-binding domain